MSNLDIVRAWKDTDYRENLQSQEKEMLPEHPAGYVELNDQDLGDVSGGTLFSLAGVSCTSCTIGWVCSC